MSSGERIAVFRVVSSATSTLVARSEDVNAVREVLRRLQLRPARQGRG